MCKERIKPLIYKDTITKYFISDNGNIFDENHKPISIFVDSRGYCKAIIIVDGIRHMIPVHRYVAAAFCKKKAPDCTDIDHIDANKLNNNYRNLEYVTPRENHRRAAEKGLYPHGEDHHGNKYSEEQIIKVCELLENPKNSYVDISKITGVNMYTIFTVYKQNKWKHISTKYDFSKRRGNEKIHPDVIRAICREFEKDHDANAYELARKYGLNKDQVYGIKYKKSYRKYSKNYNF